MKATKKIVQRDCSYRGVLLLKGSVVYVSDPHNFGRQQVFSDKGELLFFCEIEYWDFNERV